MAFFSHLHVHSEYSLMESTIKIKGLISVAARNGMKAVALTGDIEKDLRQIFDEVAKEKDVEIKALEIMPDHVHMFISFDPRQPLHKLIKLFKGKSSKILRDKYPKLKSRIPSLWTRSYFCCTIGNISEETVQKYIENQKNM